MDTPRQPVIEAALRCVARWGVSKTTLDDIAREVGLSRATVYRLFPGGKDGLIEAVVASEVHRFFAALAARLAEADDLEDALVGGMAAAGRHIQSHAALQYLIAHEPEVVVPKLAFAQLDTVLRTVGAVVGPHLERWLPAEEARRAAEWAARLVLSYASTPAPDVDVASEESVRRLVRAFVLPGLLQHVS